MDDEDGTYDCGVDHNNFHRINLARCMEGWYVLAMSYYHYREDKDRREAEMEKKTLPPAKPIPNKEQGEDPWSDPKWGQFDETPPFE